MEKVFNFRSNIAALAAFFIHGNIILSLMLPLAACNILGNLAK